MSDKQSASGVDIQALWLEYHQNRQPSIREKLIGHYLHLVRIVAGRIAIGLPQHIDKDDLISNGFFGLLDAIERFDLSRGVKFETYAITRIRGSILDALRAQDWLPASLRQKAKNYEHTLSEVEHRLGRSATDEEIAGAMNIPLTDLYQLLTQLNATTLVSLEEFVKNETACGLPVNPSQAIEEVETKHILKRQIDKLPDKERLVVSLYYFEEMTLKEISLIMHLSEARISQLHTKAIFRLRGALTRLKNSLL